MERQHGGKPAGAAGRSAGASALAGLARGLGEGRDWFILNASPDLRQQIEATPALHPRHGLRSSPIAGVVLTGGDVDAIAGLLHLRERHRFTIYAPTRVLAILAENPIFDVSVAGLRDPPADAARPDARSLPGTPAIRG